MRIIITVVLACCLLVPVVNSENREEIVRERTLESWNGQYWNSITHNEKIVFLIGFDEGLRITAYGDKACLDIQAKVKDSFLQPFSILEK